MFFGKRIADGYNEHCGHFFAKGPVQLKSRWSKVNSIIKKFGGCYKQAYPRRKKVVAYSDVMGDAYSIYTQYTHECFMLEFAWRLLKDEPK